MLKVWGRKNSINVQKVLWCCGELGLRYDRTDAGLSFGFPEGYGDINPNSLVPAISDDGFVLWESNAIVRYLAAKHVSLIPEDLRSRADVERWMDWQATTLWEGLKPIFFGMVRTPPEDRDEEAIEEACKKTAASLGVLEARLEGRRYVMGDEFTVADIPLGVSAYRWFEMEIERPEMPNVEAWYERIKERPAFQKNCMLPLT